VIETSGLALPQPLVRAFNWPEIRNRVTVDGVVTVVDGPAVAEGRFAHDEDRVSAQREADDSIDHETPLADLFEDQLACADMIVVSKSDAMEGGAAPTIDALKSRARAGVTFVPSGVGGLSPDVLLGMGKGAEDDMSARHEIHHHHHRDDEDDDHHDHEHTHGHDEFESFALTLGEIDDAEAFLDRIGAVIREHDVLRLKGFVAVNGKPMRMVVQAVGPRIETYFDRPFGDEARETRLVAIGLHGMNEAAIREALT
jgi:cobalamin biosynthesis protein CobW